jgi:hypothetical protein
MQGKQWLFETCRIWARNKGNVMSIRSATMQRMKLLILKKTISQIAKQVQGGVKGERDRKQQ